MNLTDKLKHTSSSRLADRIKSTEQELGRLISAHDQAEAEAVSKAGEDVAYQIAADRAAELDRQVAEKRERLDRLRIAHETAIDREPEEPKAPTSAPSASADQSLARPGLATDEGSRIDEV